MILVLALGAIACEKTKGTTTTETRTESTSKSAGADRTVETKTTTVTKTTETNPAVGVAECDDYLQRMSECAAKVPPAAAGAMKDAAATLRRTWTDAAASAEGRTALAAGCKQAMDAARTTYKTAGCTF